MCPPRPLSENNTTPTNFRYEVIFAAAFSTSGSCERQQRCSAVQQSWWSVQSVHKKVGSLNNVYFLLLIWDLWIERQHAKPMRPMLKQCWREMMEDLTLKQGKLATTWKMQLRCMYTSIHICNLPDGWWFTMNWCKRWFSPETHYKCERFLQNCTSHLTDHDCNSEEEVDN